MSSSELQEERMRLLRLIHSEDTVSPRFEPALTPLWDVFTSTGDLSGYQPYTLLSPMERLELVDPFGSRRAEEEQIELGDALCRIIFPSARNRLREPMLIVVAHESHLRDMSPARRLTTAHITLCWLANDHGRHNSTLRTTRVRPNRIHTQVLTMVGESGNKYQVFRYFHLLHTVKHEGIVLAKNQRHYVNLSGVHVFSRLNLVLGRNLRCPRAQGLAVMHNKRFGLQCITYRVDLEDQV